MKISFRRFFLVLFILGFVAQPTAVHAQFSDSWDFMKAVKEQDYSTMLDKINKGVNINTRDADGYPAIVLATDLQSERLVKFLLTNGVNPDAGILGSNETAMMRRADAGDMDTIRLLVEYGADVNMVNKSGETALMRAIRSRKNRVINGLIELGADISLTDYTGRTALDYAEETRSSRIIRIVRDGLEQ